MKCTICGEPIVLVPSAAERAAKPHTYQPASYYTQLFSAHATCQIEARERDTREIIRRLNSIGQPTVTVDKFEARVVRLS